MQFLYYLHFWADNGQHQTEHHKCHLSAVRLLFKGLQLFSLRASFQGCFLKFAKAKITSTLKRLYKKSRRRLYPAIFQWGSSYSSPVLQHIPSTTVVCGWGSWALTCWQVVWHFTGTHWMRLVRVTTSCSSVHTQFSQELLGTIAPGWKYRGDRR